MDKSSLSHTLLIYKEEQKQDFKGHLGDYVTQDTSCGTGILVQRAHLKADNSLPLLVPTQILVESPHLTFSGLAGLASEWALRVLFKP